jgi:TPR repeat protein
MLKTDIELLKEIYNETIPDYMNPSLDLFGKNRFDIALNCYYKKGDVFAPCLIGSFYFAGRGGLNVDLDRAIHWYKISFLKGESITAGINLGRIYTYQKQYQKAFKIYTKLATINHHQALTALGFFYKKQFNAISNLFFPNKSRLGFI